MSSRHAVLTLVACFALLAGLVASPPTFAGNASLDELFGPQAMPEMVGMPLDPAARDTEMGFLQKALSAGQVERAQARELVVPATAAELKRIDAPGLDSGRYLVGVNKPIGLGVDFAGALGKGTRDLAVGAVRVDEQGFVWTAVVRSPGATALRIHLTGVDLPAGAGLFVYDLAGHAFGPYTGRGPLGTGDLFTNTVFGDRLVLQLENRSGSPVAPLRVVELGVLGKRFVAPQYGPQGVFDPNDLGAIAKASNLCSYNASCVVNAACQSSTAVNVAKDAVATMLFSSGGGQYICTGGLIADTVSTSVIPYFLTAHHCIGSSGEASSLETYFDYQTTCSNPNCTQPYNNTGDTVGATIMSTNSSSDYCLLKLSSTPTTPDGVATYLGWLSTAVANTNNYALYRISHPKGAPQAYSEQVVDTTKGTCRTLPRGSFIYSRDTLGATEGGSSGSPVVNGAGQIVGQLYGACGTNLNDVCDSASNATVDGAFAATYPSVASWLNPGGGGSCSPAGAVCTSGSQCCSNSCKGKPGAMKCK
jgi:V8-like Glu-specific endopeptidase